MNDRWTVASVLALCLLASAAKADEFDFELGLNYGSTEVTATTNPGIGPLSLEVDQDIDAIGLSATWFFDGVVSNEGPRERAAFLAQASSVSLDYLNLDGDIVFRTISVSPTVPSTEQRSSQSGDTFGLSGRYVWKDSGWYLTGSLVSAELEIDGAGGIDTDGYALGVGKYFGNRTAVDVTISQSDSGSSDDTDVTLSATHIGDLGSTWQFAVDGRLSSAEALDADGLYNVGLTLYPSRSFGFGASVGGALGGSSFDSTSYDLFATWFPSEAIGVRASVGLVDADEGPDSDTDEDIFSIEGGFRF